MTPKREMKSDKEPETYVILKYMNIRKEPSLLAEKTGQIRAGAHVHVKDIQNDWLCLADGTFILYGNGQNAKKL